MHSFHFSDVVVAWIALVGYNEQGYLLALCGNELRMMLSHDFRLVEKELVVLLVVEFGWQKDVMSVWSKGGGGGGGDRSRPHQREPILPLLRGEGRAGLFQPGRGVLAGEPVGSPLRRPWVAPRPGKNDFQNKIRSHETMVTTTQTPPTLCAPCVGRLGIL